MMIYNEFVYLVGRPARNAMKKREGSPSARQVSCDRVCYANKTSGEWEKARKIWPRPGRDSSSGKRGGEGSKTRQSCRQEAEAHKLKALKVLRLSAW